jgi:uncharacterized protein
MRALTVARIVPQHARPTGSGADVMKAYDEVYATPGAFSWTELMTPDPKAAASFYGALLGWRFDSMPMGQGGDYTVVKVGETSIGGMMAPPPDAPPMPPMWGPYVTVTSAEETVQKCQSLGGKLIAGPMDIPNVGRFAVLQDPQGAVFNVIAYVPMPS